MSTNAGEKEKEKKKGNLFYLITVLFLTALAAEVAYARALWLPHSFQLCSHRCGYSDITCWMVPLEPS